MLLASASSYAGLGTTVVGVVLGAILATLGWIGNRLLQLSKDVTTLVTELRGVVDDVNKHDRSIDALRSNQTELATVLAAIQAKGTPG